MVEPSRAAGPQPFIPPPQEPVMTALGKSGPQSEGEVYLPGLDWGWLLGELRRDSNLYRLFSDMSQPRVGLF